MGLQFKGILISLLILLPNIIYLCFPARNVPHPSSEPSMLFTVIEQIGRIGCFVLPILFGEKIARQKFSFLVILMGICLLLYYLCWIRYFITGRNFSCMFKPLWMILIPMAVFPILYFLLLGIWTQSALFLAAAVLFAIGHSVVSWHTYLQTNC